MARLSKLTYHRGTLILHPPPPGKVWLDYAAWDDRVEKYRIPGYFYRPFVEAMNKEGTAFIDEAKNFSHLELKLQQKMSLYPHQQEALQAWEKGGKRGIIVLPTGAGKTYLAQLVMESTPYSTLIIVPTLDLMQQWYAQLEISFPGVELGLLGGGSRDRTPILIATYNSAAIHGEDLGNRYGLLIFDECHHLPTDFFRVIAEDSIAPYRLGISATPERTDSNHYQLEELIGPILYRKSPQDLSGIALAKHQTIQIKVKLSPEEQERYDRALQTRNEFLRRAKISLRDLQGWQNFVQASARSSAGRRAMLAHRESKEIALCTEEKLQVLNQLIAQHYPAKILIFTSDNTTVYRVSQEFLIPALTHQTPVKERHTILTRFRSGEYQAIVASHVLNEGVDVPDAAIAIILSGTGSHREYIQRLGRILRKGKEMNKLAILYEIVAEDTSEENTSERRKSHQHQPSPSTLQLFPEQPLYIDNSPRSKKAAESSSGWGDLDENY